MHVYLNFSPFGSTAYRWLNVSISPYPHSRSFYPGQQQIDLSGDPAPQHMGRQPPGQSGSTFSRHRKFKRPVHGHRYAWPRFDAVPVNDATLQPSTLLPAPYSTQRCVPWPCLCCGEGRWEVPSPSCRRDEDGVLHTSPWQSGTNSSSCTFIFWVRTIWSARVPRQRISFQKSAWEQRKQHDVKMQKQKPRFLR